MPSLVQEIKSKLPFANYSPEDRKILAICFGIAFFFWLLVKLSNEYTISKVLELNYDLPIGLAFSSEPIRQVTVELSGTGWGLLAARLPARQLRLGFAIGERETYILTSFEVGRQLGALLGRRITIKQLNFSNMRIQLEPRTQIRLPVMVQHNLVFEAGYSLMRKIEVEPDSVSVEGPESKLSVLQYISTDSLLLPPLKQSVSRKVELQNMIPEMRIFPPQVKVHVLVEQITEKAFYVPVEIVNGPPEADSIRIFPDKAYVKCILGLSRYSNLSASDFRLIADFGDTYLKDERNSIPLTLAYKPDYVKSVSYSPVAAEFFLIEKEKEVEGTEE